MSTRPDPRQTGRSQVQKQKGNEQEVELFSVAEGWTHLTLHCVSHKHHSPLVLCVSVMGTASCPITSSHPHRWYQQQLVRGSSYFCDAVSSSRGGVPSQHCICNIKLQFLKLKPWSHFFAWGHSVSGLVSAIRKLSALGMALLRGTLLRSDTSALGD